MKKSDKFGNTREIARTYTIDKITKGKSVHYSVSEWNNGTFVDACGFDTKKEALDYIKQTNR